MVGTSSSKEVSTMSCYKVSTMSCYKPVNYVPERFTPGFVHLPLAITIRGLMGVVGLRTTTDSFIVRVDHRVWETALKRGREDFSFVGRLRISAARRVLSRSSSSLNVSLWSLWANLFRILATSLRES